MDARHNNIIKLDSNLGRCTSLRVLGLANNLIAKLPIQLGGLVGIQDLSLHGNPITFPGTEFVSLGIDTVLGYIYALSMCEENNALSLDGMGLSRVPPDVMQYKGLVTLSFSNNYIENVPSSISGLELLTSLVAANNRIKEIPESLCNIESLQKIDLSRNFLTILPEKLGFMPNLCYMYFENNNIRAIPTDLGYLSGVKELQLEDNPLEFPFSLMRKRGTKAILKYLEDAIEVAESNTMMLAGQFLRKIPPSVWEEDTVVGLEIHGNSLSGELEGLSMLTALRNLQLQENLFKMMPSEVCTLTELKSLRLSHNKLRTIPDEVSRLKLCEHFDISDNNLVAVSDSVCRMFNLKVLTIDNNYVRTLPSILNLTALECLSIIANRVQTLDATDAEVAVSLRELWIARNEFAILPPWIHDRRTIEYVDVDLPSPESNVAGTFYGPDIKERKRKAKEKCKDWVEGLRLDFASMFLDDIPLDTFKKIELESLYLCGNRFSEMPARIGFLINLTEMSLIQNELSDLPDSLGTLGKLQYLGLDHNHFEEIPPCVFQLHSLERLTVSHCRLSGDISSDMGSAKALQVFWIHANQLAAIPSEIGACSSLTELRANDNQIEFFPDSIHKCTALTLLHLGHNKLSSIPPAVGALSCISDMRLYPNPLPEVELELVKTGTHHASRFYKAVFLAKETGHLDLAAQGMQDLPKCTFSLEGLTSISLSDNIIQELPPDICMLSSIKTLYLGRNFLSSLPPEMTGLALHELFMQDNKLLSLPAVVHVMGTGDVTSTGHPTPPSLRVLDVSRNSIIALPTGIGEMKMLERLVLKQNKLKNLSYIMGGLKRLKVLDASSNHISSIPSELAEMHSLEELYLQENQLIMIPNSLATGPRYLRVLNIARNRLTSLPLHFASLTSIEMLHLEGNPWKVPCEEIRMRGTLHTLRFAPFPTLKPPSFARLAFWNEALYLTCLLAEIYQAPAPGIHSHTCRGCLRSLVGLLFICLSIYLSISLCNSPASPSRVVFERFHEVLGLS